MRDTFGWNSRVYNKTLNGRIEYWTPFNVGWWKLVLQGSFYGNLAFNSEYILQDVKEYQSYDKQRLNSKKQSFHT